MTAQPPAPPAATPPQPEDENMTASPGASEAKAKRRFSPRAAIVSAILALLAILLILYA